ncbi:MAG: hypothetical protein ABI852_03450 [Gemmatimonadaceae bacterium]
MGLTWAVVWAPIAVVIGTQVIDPSDTMDEMWWMVGAMPGFISGVVFSVVLGTAARRRRLEELSIVRVGGWGALAGLATGILPFLIGDAGDQSIWPLAMVVIPTFTLVSALSAAASLAVARRAQNPATRNDDDTGNQIDTNFESPVSIPAGMSRFESAALKPSAVKHEPPVR